MTDPLASAARASPLVLRRTVVRARGRGADPWRSRHPTWPRSALLWVFIGFWGVLALGFAIEPASVGCSGLTAYQSCVSTYWQGQLMLSVMGVACLSAYGLWLAIALAVAWHKLPPWAWRAF